MASFDFMRSTRGTRSLIRILTAGLAVLVANAPALADTPLWTARNIDGRVIFDSFPFGPSAGNDVNYLLEQVPGEPTFAEDFLGFQFLDDGTLWTARDLDGRVIFDSFPFGPSSGNDVNYLLEQVPGQPTFTEDFLGFQFLDDGTLWTARDLDGRVIFDSFPFGPSSGNDVNYLLEQVPGQPTFTEDFLGFQFLDDGTLWIARDLDGRVIFDSFPFGPSSGNDVNYLLEQAPGEPTFTEDFLGFQFLDDGTLWTARDLDGRVIFDSFPFGPSGGNDVNYPLEQVPGEPTFTENFLGFQFLQASAPGAVPEPATWATLLAGIGMIGWRMRRRTTPMPVPVAM